MARTAALFPRNRAVPRSVVNALHPTRRNNNNSAPYTQYSFGGRYPYPNEKKMVKAYRRARQLKTDELRNFLKMLKNKIRKTNILGIRNYNEEKFFEMFKNKSIPQNVIKFLGEKMRKNTS